ncbi:dihydropteroate synthase [Ferruginibacter sp.]
MFTLNCKGKLLAFESPIIMGIINATPDSFYKGNINEDMLALAKKMIDDGATILDIGGQSTRPGSSSITAEEEIQRVLPVIEAIHKNFPDTIISIDTYSSKVAVAAVKAGAAIVNDISAGNMDEQMIEMVAQLKLPYVCMHMQGTPADMHKNPQYNDVVKEVLDFFITKIEQCKSAGIVDIIIDPGFGFGKTIEHNFSLLKKMNVLQMLDKPILAGLSRKSSIYKTLGTTVQNALNGTTVLNTIALQNGASILRVHDVKEAAEAIKLFTAYKKAP